MELLRRPTILAAAAAVVLAIDVVALVTDGPVSPTVDDVADDQPTEAASSPAIDDGTDGTEGTGAPTEGDGTSDGDEGTDGTDGTPATLEAPTPGTYAYTAGGSWSVQSSSGTEDHPLPETATAEVTADGGSWQLRLVAGEDYADVFGFVPAAGGGLDWSSWVLERGFEGGAAETAYSCSGDAAFYVPGEAGRTTSHTCTGPQEIVSQGTVEQTGPEEVQLGDGSTVMADRLVYRYTVSSPQLEGQGQLDLWLDQTTGLRLREARTITTVTQTQGGELTYNEAVEFTLQALAG